MRHEQIYSFFHDLGGALAGASGVLSKLERMLVSADPIELTSVIAQLESLRGYLGRCAEIFKSFKNYHRNFQTWLGEEQAPDHSHSGKILLIHSSRVAAAKLSADLSNQGLECLVGQDPNTIKEERISAVLIDQILCEATDWAIWLTDLSKLGQLPLAPVFAILTPDQAVRGLSASWLDDFLLINDTPAVMALRIRLAISARNRLGLTQNRLYAAILHSHVEFQKVGAHKLLMGIAGSIAEIQRCFPLEFPHQDLLPLLEKQLQQIITIYHQLNEAS